jgi:hypothetical protein
MMWRLKTDVMWGLKMIEDLRKKVIKDKLLTPHREDAAMPPSEDFE